jgi:ArsR family transcriptional regulator
MPTSPKVDIRNTARLFHALSDETRIAIIVRLRDGEKCVCDLTDLLDAAQSRLSFHLKTLKDAGLVRDRRNGRWVHYSLNRETLGEIENLIGTLKPSRRLLAHAADCCD